MFAALCQRAHPLKHSLAESIFVSRVRKTAKKIFVSRTIRQQGHSLAEVSLYDTLRYPFIDITKYFSGLQFKEGVMDRTTTILFYYFLLLSTAQWLRCCATNRKVAGSIPASVNGFFIDIISFRSHSLAESIFVSQVRETAKKIFVSRKIRQQGHSLAEVSLYIN